MAAKKSSSIPALRVKQWLPEWDEIHFNSKTAQAKPSPYFYLFSIKASDLKALTGVYQRSTKNMKARAVDQNVQRGYEEERSEKIREFVEYGFPWCEMSEGKRKTSADLRQPGWLPTAILVNILPPRSKRNGTEIADADLVRVSDEGDSATLRLPTNFSGHGWGPKSIFPLEVIDGQHRLWAFENFDAGDFELPVVAFFGLDMGWQAYLFWSVNITPKRINRSLADRVPRRGVAAALPSCSPAELSRLCQAVTADSLTMGSSLNGAMVSRLM